MPDLFISDFKVLKLANFYLYSGVVVLEIHQSLVQVLTLTMKLVQLLLLVMVTS